MDNWNTSRHSYAKPRLLGEIKTEYVYLNLCTDHKFISPRYTYFKPNNAITYKSPSKMRELRESLRQAALINIVASVNEEDKPDNRSLCTEGINIKSNQYGIQDFFRERTNLHFQERSSPRDSRVPDSSHYEKQRLCPKLKLSEALSEHSHTKRELSILEGRRIEAPYFKENLNGKVKHVKPGSDSEIDLRVQTVSSVAKSSTSNNKPKNPHSTFNGHTENPVTNSGRSTHLQCVLHSGNILSANPDAQRIIERSHDGLKSVSSHDSGTTNIDFKHHTSMRDTLHISTIDGDIGRSVGYFPTPRSTNKRDPFVSKRQLVETRLSKCDAVDILDPISNADDSEYPMIIKSQRDNLGEMGTCLFGMTRTNPHPSVNCNLKRNKRRHKQEKELIVLSAPIARQSRDSSDDLKGGIVGVNIAGEISDERLETKQNSSPISVDRFDSTVTSVITNITSENGVHTITIPADKIENPTYHLENARNFNSPKSASTISLEGHGLPAVLIKDGKSQTQRSSRHPHLSSLMRSEIQSREQGSRSQNLFEGDVDTLPHLSEQVYDFRGLSIGSDAVSSDNSYLLKQIKPMVRKAGVILNNTSSLSYTPRPRPINASLSTNKLTEDTKRSLQMPTPITMVEEDLERRSEGSVNLSICASKIEDTKTLKETTHSIQTDGFHEETTEPRRMFSDDGSSSSSGYCKRRDVDFLLYSNSDSDVDITQIEPPKTPVVSRKNKKSSAIAKHQGMSSMNTNRDKLTKLHVIKDDDKGIKETTVKILKSLDQDIYADFTHRKLRNVIFSNNNDSETSKVVLVKVRCSTKEPLSLSEITNNNYETVPHNTKDFNDSDRDSDSDLS